jgi:hypothetical protein
MAMERSKRRCNSVKGRKWSTPRLLKLGLLQTAGGRPKDGETGQGHGPAVS